MRHRLTIMVDFDPEKVRGNKLEEFIVETVNDGQYDILNIDSCIDNVKDDDPVYDRGEEQFDELPETVCAGGFVATLTK